LNGANWTGGNVPLPADTAINNVPDSIILIANGDAISITTLQPQTGKVSMSGGALNATNLQVIGSTGAFLMTGGITTVTNDSRIAASDGVFDIAGGTLNFNKMVIGSVSGATNAVMTVSGNAVVNQNQGTALNHELWIGGNNGGSGALILKDNASWTGSPRTSGTTLVVGNNGVGQGTFTIQDNAQFTYSGTAMRVADQANNGGTVNLNGGTTSLIGMSKGAGTGTVNADGGKIRALAASANFFNGFNEAGGVNSVNLLAGGLNFDTNGFAVTVSNPLSGPGGLTKSGNGTLTISGANNYTGATLVSAGILSLDGLLTGSNITVNGTGATFNQSATGTIDGGGSTFTVSNGSASLAGTNTYTGATNIQGGVLNLSGSLASNVIIGNSASLTGEGSTTGSLTFASGGTSNLFFDPSTPGTGFSANTIVATGATVKVTPATAPVGSGIVVLNSISGIMGTLSNFQVNARGSLSLTSTKLLFSVDAAASLKWKGNDGTNPSFWDAGVTTNWDNGGSPDKFYAGDNVTFDDTANSFVVAAQGVSVGAGNVTFANSINDYILQGAPYAGTGLLTKSGSAKVTIVSTNSYSGGTTISAGTVQLGDGIGATGSLGSGAVVNNGTLVTNYGSNNVSLINDISGGGSLTQNGNGILTLTGAGSYTGTTTINAGTLQIGAGSTAGSVGTGDIIVNGSLALNRSDTFSIGGNISGTGSVIKLGPGTATLGGNTSVGTVNVGVNNTGGTLAVASGKSIAIGTGGIGSITIGVSTSPTTASGILDASSASDLTANVATIAVGATGNNNVVGQGTLMLPANSTITAGTSIVIGTSTGAVNLPASTITTAAGGTATIQTPAMTIGGTKSVGAFTLGAGSTLELSGILDGRTALDIGRSVIEGGGVQPYSGTADMSAGIFKGTLASLVIGHAEAGTGSWNETGDFTLSSNPANHLDIVGAGSPVVVGRWVSGNAGISNSATGTFTIGNLNATSSIISIDNNTAILVGTGGTAGVQRATGTLNLNGGTLAITTSGAAISGDTVNLSNVSTVNFNGTTLKAGASSTNWINALTNANVSTGGVKIDTNGNDIAIGQVFQHDTALGAALDGGLTKSGNGALTLTGANSYTGPTTVNGGILLVNGSASSSAVTASAGGTIGGTGTLGVLNVLGTGSLAPGAGPGTLTVDTLNLNADSMVKFELVLGDTTIGSGINDLVTVIGNFTLDGTLQISKLGTGTFGDNALYTLFDYGAELSLVDNGLQIDTAFLAEYPNASIVIDTVNTRVLLSVPEPSAVLSLLGGIGILLGLRRRRTP
jgi:fibronectin-binding autotransporter adhesin